MCLLYYSFHWYLCIICNPKHALPPQTPPPRPAATIPKKITEPVTGQEQTKTIEVMDLEADDEMDTDTTTVTTNSPPISSLPQPLPESEPQTGSGLQSINELPDSALQEMQKSIVNMIEEDRSMPSERRQNA
jgi:Ulp1 family protease